MKNQLTALSLVVMLTLLILASCNRNQSARVNEAVEVRSTELIPDASFQQAIEAFVDKDYARSAKAIEQAAFDIERLAAVAGPRYKEQMLTSVANLRDLATDVSTDHVDGIQDLNYFFAEAGKSLAGMYAETSETSYFNLQGSLAGEELLKAIDQVESGLRYHGRETNAEEKALFTEVRTYARKIRDGKPTSNEEMEQQLGRIRDYLNKRDAEIELLFAPIQNKRKTLVRKAS